MRETVVCGNCGRLYVESPGYCPACGSSIFVGKDTPPPESPERISEPSPGENPSAAGEERLGFSVIDVVTSKDIQEFMAGAKKLLDQFEGFIQELRDGTRVRVTIEFEKREEKQ